MSQKLAKATFKSSNFCTSQFRKRETTRSAYAMEIGLLLGTKTYVYIIISVARILSGVGKGECGWCLTSLCACLCVYLTVCMYICACKI